jgi:hypothetical protein
MAKYTIELTHRFLVETDDIKEVLSNYEFPDFESTNAKDWEFLDGKNTYYEEAEND